MKDIATKRMLRIARERLNSKLSDEIADMLFRLTRTEAEKIMRKRGKK